MKIGVEIKINVNEIKKELLFQGQKGKYLTLTTFIDIENKDQYGNNGFVKQSAEKGVEMSILGNSKVFWSDSEEPRQEQPRQGQEEPEEDDSIPF